MANSANTNKASGLYSEFTKLMAETDLSGAELARRIDVFPSTVSSWATGKVDPPGAVMAYLRLLSQVKRVGA